MAKLDNGGRPVYRISGGIAFKVELKSLAAKFEFERPAEGEGVSIDLDALDNQLTSIEFVYKPDVTLAYNGRVRDPFIDMFFPPEDD